MLIDARIGPAAAEQHRHKQAVPCQSSIQLATLPLPLYSLLLRHTPDVTLPSPLASRFTSRASSSPARRMSIAHHRELRESPLARASIRSVYYCSSPPPLACPQAFTCMHMFTTAPQTTPQPLAASRPCRATRRSLASNRSFLTYKKLPCAPPSASKCRNRSYVGVSFSILRPLPSVPLARS